MNILCINNPNTNECTVFGVVVVVVVVADRSGLKLKMFIVDEK